MLSSQLVIPLPYHSAIELLEPTALATHVKAQLQRLQSFGLSLANHHCLNVARWHEARYRSEPPYYVAP